MGGVHQHLRCMLRDNFPGIHNDDEWNLACPSSTPPSLVPWLVFGSPPKREPNFFFFVQSRKEYVAATLSLSSVSKADEPKRSAPVMQEQFVMNNVGVVVICVCQEY